MLYRFQIEAKISELEAEKRQAETFFNRTHTETQRWRIVLVNEKLESYRRLLKKARNPKQLTPLGANPHKREVYFANDVRYRESKKNKGHYADISGIL